MYFTQLYLFSNIISFFVNELNISPLIDMQLINKLSALTQEGNTLSIFVMKNKYLLFSIFGYKFIDIAMSV